jgi:nucleoside-diphosphate-sugar epimerase
MAKRILVLGALGQIGTELIEELRAKHGTDNVLATDIRHPESYSGPFEILDANNALALGELVGRFQPDEVYHMVAMLSATAEKHPMPAWNLNMNSLFHVLELAKAGRIGRVFWPSSIAAFGPNSPKDPCLQTTVMDPSTVYGISKLSGELWCNYYHQKFGVDVRSIRYPGLISWKAEPGGGTTDYAVEIFSEALKKGRYTSYINSGTRLPMMYMPDAIKATIQLMEAPAERVRLRTSYNIAAFSFDPIELAEAIRNEQISLELEIDPDFRDQIAQGWPAVIDDSEAREHWGHSPSFSLQQMTQDMLFHLKKKLL